MKQLKHHNILPFYGVSTTVSDFCLVFPWYENGSIMDYLKKKPDINRFDLASISGKLHHSDAYLHSRTVIGCDQRIALYARKPPGSRRSETSM